MPSLADTLKALGLKPGADLRPDAGPRRPRPIEAAIPGRVWPTRAGEAYAVEARYPAGHRQGVAALRGDAPMDMLAAWAGDARVRGMPLEAFAFLDTETTGLSGGAGTLVFMVGVGRFEGGGFHLTQFFLRELAEEAAMLTALEQFLAPCQALVTFNGKAFDAPLLNNRYALHGWPSPLNGAVHLDLLPLARRLWRDRLPSRRLGELEAEILRASRTEEETPGYLVPVIYQEYLQTGDPVPLKGVFYHNAMDVLSMAALLAHIAGMLADPLQAAYELDWLALGRLHEEMGRLDSARQLYTHCLGRPIESEAWLEAARRLSFLFKREGNWTAAVKLWKAAAGRGKIYAYEELAKFYEHQAGDVQSAREWTEAALAQLEQPGFPLMQRFQWKPAFDRRQARLERKAQKAAGALEG